MGNLPKVKDYSSTGKPYFAAASTSRFRATRSYSLFVFTILSIPTGRCSIPALTSDMSQGRSSSSAPTGSLRCCLNALPINSLILLPLIYTGLIGVCDLATSLYVYSANSGRNAIGQFGDWDIHTTAFPRTRACS